MATRSQSVAAPSTSTRRQTDAAGSMSIRRSITTIIDTMRTSWSTKNDKKASKKMRDIANRLFYRGAYLNAATLQGGDSDLVKDLTLIRVLLCEVRQAVVDVFYEEKKRGTKGDKIFVGHRWLLDGITELEQLMVPLSLRLEQVHTATSTHIIPLIPVCEAPLVFIEERLTYFEDKERSILFEQCGELRSLRFQVDSYISRQYDPMLILLFITETMGRAVLTTLFHTEHRHVYTPDLLGAFCSCRANVLAYLHAYHGVDLNKTSTKLNSATNRVVVHRPAPDTTSVKTSAVVAAIKASSPAHNTLLPLPSRDHLRYMTEGQMFTGYFPVMDGHPPPPPAPGEKAAVYHFQQRRIHVWYSAAEAERTAYPTYTDMVVVDEMIEPAKYHSESTSTSVQPTPRGSNEHTPEATPNARTRVLPAVMIPPPQAPGTPGTPSTAFGLAPSPVKGAMNDPPSSNSNSSGGTPRSSPNFPTIPTLPPMVPSMYADPAGFEKSTERGNPLTQPKPELLQHRDNTALRRGTLSNIIGRDRGCIYWVFEGEDKIETASQCIRISLISDIYMGRKTPIFKSNFAKKAPPDRCLSIKTSEGRELILEAETSDKLGAFLAALNRIMTAGGKLLHVKEANTKPPSVPQQQRPDASPERNVEEPPPLSTVASFDMPTYDVEQVFVEQSTSPTNIRSPNNNNFDFTNIDMTSPKFGMYKTVDFSSLLSQQRPSPSLSDAFIPPTTNTTTPPPPPPLPPQHKRTPSATSSTPSPSNNIYHTADPNMFAKLSQMRTGPPPPLPTMSSPSRDAAPPPLPPATPKSSGIAPPLPAPAPLAQAPPPPPFTRRAVSFSVISPRNVSPSPSPSPATPSPSSST